MEIYGCSRPAPQLSFKVLVEEFVGVTACMTGDMAPRPNFGLNELDFVFSTLVVGSMMNLVSMYLLASTLGSSSPNLPSIFANCPPSHMFEPSAYGVINRVGTSCPKERFSLGLGFACELVGTAILNGLIKLRKKMDPKFETPNKPPPTLLNALTWAAHMGLSSNLRYQTLNGVEDLLAKGLPQVVFKVLVLVLRCLNDDRLRSVDTMDISPFKQDIDELIHEFSKSNSTTLADMKKIWLARKFTFIYEARPTKNEGLFMQSLFAISLGHMLSTDSLSQSLGGFYCLYCLFETQPVKPPYKIYLSLGELKRLKSLVVEAKKANILVMPAIVNKLLEKNVFLFGSVEINDRSVTERVAQIDRSQKAHMKVAHDKLLAKTPIKKVLHMDLGKEIDLKAMKKTTAEYEAAKGLAIREAGEVMDIQNIKHIAENKKTAADVMEKIVSDWNTQREQFHQKTKSAQPSSAEGNEMVMYEAEGADHSANEGEGENSFCMELEDLIYQNN